VDIAICFEVECVKSAYEEVKKKNNQIGIKYVAYAPAYTVFMRANPDGNIIEFTGCP
jgi:hypothetical protein